MNKVFLALGSNTGFKKKNIEKALRYLNEKISDIKTGGFYETEPQYYTKQNKFINTAISGYTKLSPKELLSFIKAVEVKTGRKPTFKYGPREIDIDILFFDNIVFSDNLITIPHKLIQEREFVLKPLNDLEPEFVHPVLGKTIGELYKSLLK